MADAADEMRKRLIERDEHLRRVREEQERAEQRRAQAGRDPSRGGEPKELGNVVQLHAPVAIPRERVRQSFEERIAAADAFTSANRIEEAEQRLRAAIARDVSDATREDLYREHRLATPALDVVQHWWEDRGDYKHLLVCGPKGVGKTFAAAWCAREYLRGHRSERVCWLHVSQLPGAIMFNDTNVPPLARFVVVDDIGRELQDPELIGECLVKLIERADTRVLMTSNLSRRQRVALADGRDVSIFEARYKDRFASKFNGRVRAVDVLGEDLRGDGGGF